MPRSIRNDTSIVEPVKPVDWYEFVRRFEGPRYKDTSNKIIGYEKTIKHIEELFDLLLNCNTKFDLLMAQRCTLLTGPPGTGKTYVVKKLLESRPGINFFYLRSSWTLEKQFKNPELQLRYLFEEAAKKAPSVIFIDKLELVCGVKRTEIEKIIFNILEERLAWLNSEAAGVLVFGATDQLESIDPRLRKSWFFNDEIRFSLPTRQDRLAYLREIVGKIRETRSSGLTLNQLEEIANATHCYTYIDIIKMFQTAARQARQVSPKTKAPITYLNVNFETIKSTLTSYKPPTLKSVTSPCPPLRWDDIGGVEDVKEELRESVIWPLIHKDKFQRLGLKSNKGVILYGPPGCSKTMLAQALATESGYNFISVKGPEFNSKFVGDTEAAVRKLYRTAREIAPCIIFFDEIDGFAPDRSKDQGSSVGQKVVTTLLPELDGIDTLDEVFTIAATNRPDNVDSALLRPGRLDPAIYIPLPGVSDRAEIFKVHLQPLSCDFDGELQDSIVDRLAQATHGYSGAEIANVCRVAGMLALRENLKNDYIKLIHFEEALNKVKPRTKQDDLRAYAKFYERSLQVGGRQSLAGQSLPSTSTMADDFENLVL